MEAAETIVLDLKDTLKYSNVRLAPETARFLMQVCSALDKQRKTR